MTFEHLRESKALGPLEKVKAQSNLRVDDALSTLCVGTQEEAVKAKS